MAVHTSIVQTLARMPRVRELVEAMAGLGGREYLRILGYHGTPASAAGELKKQFAWLASRFDPAGEEDLAAFLGFLAGAPGSRSAALGRLASLDTGSRHDGTGARPKLIITFDDGLRSNYEVAAPLLEEAGLRGWFFVCSGLASCPATEQAGFCDRASILLDSKTREEARQGGRLAMNAGEIRDLVARGHLVGSHGASHLRFTEGLDPALVRSDLETSSAWLSGVLGSAPTSFAWVGGERVSTYGRSGLEGIARAGFDFAFTTKSAPVRAGCDPLLLPRSIVDADMDFDLFRLKVSGATDLAHTGVRKAIVRSLCAPRGGTFSPEHPGRTAPGQVSARTWRLYPDIASAVSVWDVLESAVQPYPFQRRLWIECWADTVGRSRNVEVKPLVLEDRSGRKALCALAVERRGRLRRLVWAGGTVSDYGAPLLEPGFRGSPADFSAAIQGAARALGCDLVDLGHIPALLADGRGNPLRFLAPVKAGSSFRSLPPEHVAAHSLALPADMDTYRASHFSAKARGAHRRSERRLAELDGRLAESDAGTRRQAERPDWVSASSQEEGLRILEVLLAQKRSRYASTSALDPFGLPGVSDFYREAWRRRLPGVEIAALTAGPRILAAYWGLREGDSRYVMLPSFDGSPEVSKHSPGLLLSLRLIESSIADRLELVDFTLGDEPYKALLCEYRMPMYRFMFGITLRGRIESCIGAGLDRARRSPLLLDMARRSRKWLRQKESPASQPSAPQPLPPPSLAVPPLADGAAATAPEAGSGFAIPESAARGSFQPAPTESTTRGGTP